MTHHFGGQIFYTSVTQAHKGISERDKKLENIVKIVPNHNIYE